MARPMKDIEEATTETNTEPHGPKGKKGGPAG